jgi:ABC-type polysaccharide/polyol phosphate transport system ATPase subunit
MATMQKMCQRAMWLDHGTMRLVGTAQMVAEEYQRALGKK